MKIKKISYMIMKWKGLDVAPNSREELTKKCHM